MTRIDKEQFKKQLTYWLHETPEAQEFVRLSRLAPASFLDEWLEATYFYAVASKQGDARQVVADQFYCHEE